MVIKSLVTQQHTLSHILASGLSTDSGFGNVLNSWPGWVLGWSEALDVRMRFELTLDDLELDRLTAFLPELDKLFRSASISSPSDSGKIMQLY